MNSGKGRLMSLDALRGFDMFFIMGLATFVTAVCKLFPGGADCWLATQMTHVAWDGFRHHDTIFPLFLFLAGVSFPFSYAKQVAAGSPKKKIRFRIFRRALVLVILGLVCNGLLKFDLAHLRYFSVLARIGLAWMFAALLFINTRPSTRAVICAVILLGYSLLLLIPAPDAPGFTSLSKEGNIVGWIDRTLFGSNHLYRECYDPEGLLSTLPAIVTALLGMFAGELVRAKRISGNKKALYLFAAALVLLGAGLLWNLWQPCNKALWSPAFVLLAGAYSAGMFALFYYLIDVRGWRKWTLPFTVVGMNSITIFMAQRIIDFRKVCNFFLGGLAGMVPEAWAAVINAAGYMLACWLFLFFLYKKNVFLKV